MGLLQERSSQHIKAALSFAGDLTEGDIVHFGYGDVEMILNSSIETEKNIAGHPVESVFVYSCMARRAFIPNQIEAEIKPFQQLAPVTGFSPMANFSLFPGNTRCSTRP